jgi:pheromone a factor receptor
MRSPELPATAACAVVLLLLLLPTQLRVRNVAILAPMACLILVDITYFVNTLVWAGNVRDIAPIWCDISKSLSTPIEILDGKLTKGAATNIWFSIQYVAGGAALCISVRLERITSFCTAVLPQRRRVHLEVIVCCLLPILSVPLRASTMTRFSSHTLKQ